MTNILHGSGNGDGGSSFASDLVPLDPDILSVAKWQALLRGTQGTGRQNIATPEQSSGVSALSSSTTLDAGPGAAAEPSGPPNETLVAGVDAAPLLAGNFTVMPDGSVPAIPPSAPAVVSTTDAASATEFGPAVAPTGSGLTIHLAFDAAAQAAPASFRTGMQTAANLIQAAVTLKHAITVNLTIQYNENGIPSGSAYAGPSTGLFVPYATVRSDLIANAANGDSNFNSLPNGSTIQGQSQVAVWNAQLKVFGLLPATATGEDGLANFSATIPSNLLVGVALHELTHALGRVPYGPQPDIFDFYRFTSPGNRLFLNTATAPPAYFSLDGGTTKLADYGQSSDASDFLNSGVQGPNDSFNEFYGSNTLQTLSAVDLTQLDVLGFNTLAGPTLFSSAFLGFQGFGADISGGGWVSQTLYPRQLADVSGDGKADIVGFGSAATYVSLATSGGNLPRQSPASLASAPMSAAAAGPTKPSIRASWPT